MPLVQNKLFPHIMNNISDILPNGNFSKREELLNQSADRSNNSTDRSKSDERAYMAVLPSISNKNNQSLIIRKSRKSVDPITSIKRSKQSNDKFIMDKNLSLLIAKRVNF